MLENEKSFVPLRIECARAETQLFVNEDIAVGVHYISRVLGERTMT